MDPSHRSILQILAKLVHHTVSVVHVSNECQAVTAVRGARKKERSFRRLWHCGESNVKCKGKDFVLFRLSCVSDVGEYRLVFNS